MSSTKAAGGNGKLREKQVCNNSESCPRFVTGSGTSVCPECGARQVHVKMADGSTTVHTYSTDAELADIMELAKRQVKASRTTKRTAQRRATRSIKAYTESLSGD